MSTIVQQLTNMVTPKGNTNPLYFDVKNTIVDKVIQYKEEGIPNTQICELLRISPHKVTYIINANGHPKGLTKILSKQQINELRILKLKNVPDKLIARKLKVSLFTIGKYSEVINDTNNSSDSNNHSNSSTAI